MALSKDALKRHPNKRKIYDTLTTGRVVDTNDPQQMGRVRVLCSSWGDDADTPLKDIPWATYISSFAGVSSVYMKGPQQEPSNGATAYGTWSIPTIGATVLVGCIDGDPSFRFWLGCLQPQLMPHTMPHGRYLWNEDEFGNPDGPVDSWENPIQPLYDSFTKQFTNNKSLIPDTPSDPRRNMEYRTRAVDTQVAAITGIHIDSTHSFGTEIADHTYGQFHTITQEDGTEFILEGVGYSISQIEPTAAFRKTIYNYDSQTYSWTTPGFHSISMDDRYWNARMRFRTTSGNQVILDDTNERIYINTAQGNTWIELDQVGNIDIYAGRNISVRADGDINYTTEQTFRVKAKQGIHMHTDGEYRATSGGAMHVHSGSTLKLSSSQGTDIKTGSGDMRLQSGGGLFANSSGDTTFNASGSFLVTGSQIHLNGPPAATLNLQTANEAYWTSRVPEHEPWARVFMSPSSSDQDTGNSWQPEYSYTDTQVGRGSNERGETYDRNPHWRR